SASVFRNGTAIDLRLVDAGKGVSLTANAKGGDGRLTLGNVDVTGSLRKLTGKTADLTGTLFTTKAIGTVTLGNLAGRITAGDGDIGSVNASSMTHAIVLAAVVPGVP